MSTDMIDYNKECYETVAIIISRIPKTLSQEFTEWCKKRGYTRTGKLQRVMDSYIRGKIDDGVQKMWRTPHWKTIKKRHSLEWKRICRHYPDDEMVSICIQGVPKELKDRFNNYCALHGYSAAGKLRKIMLDCINGDLHYKGHEFKQ